VDFDWAALAAVFSAAAAGGGALGDASLTPEAAAGLLGSRLAVLHYSRVLCDDAAARLRVAAAAVAAGVAHRNALEKLLHTSALWRLSFVRFFVRPGFIPALRARADRGANAPSQVLCGGRVARDAFIEKLVALIAASAAPHPTGLPDADDAADVAAAAADADVASAPEGIAEEEEEEVDGDAIGDDEPAAADAAADAVMDDAEVMGTPPPVAAPSAAAAAAAAEEEEAAAAAGTPADSTPARPVRRGGGGGGVGFTPPPSSGKRRLGARRAGAAALAAEADAARAAQLAAAEGFPTPADVGAAAARLLGAVRRPLFLRCTFLRCTFLFAKTESYFSVSIFFPPPSAAAEPGGCGGGVRRRRRRRRRRPRHEADPSGDDAGRAPPRGA
jgi:hypothetical protein